MFDKLKIFGPSGTKKSLKLKIKDVLTLPKKGTKLTKGVAFDEAKLSKEKIRSKLKTAKRFVFKHSDKLPKLMSKAGKKLSNIPVPIRYIIGPNPNIAVNAIPPSDLRSPYVQRILRWDRGDLSPLPRHHKPTIHGAYPPKKASRIPFPIMDPVELAERKRLVLERNGWTPSRAKPVIRPAGCRPEPLKMQSRPWARKALKDVIFELPDPSPCAQDGTDTPSPALSFHGPSVAPVQRHRAALEADSDVDIRRRVCKPHPRLERDYVSAFDCNGTNCGSDDNSSIGSPGYSPASPHSYVSGDTSHANTPRTASFDGVTFVISPFTSPAQLSVQMDRPTYQEDIAQDTRERYNRLSKDLAESTNLYGSVGLLLAPLPRGSDWPGRAKKPTARSAGHQGSDVWWSEHLRPTSF